MINVSENTPLVSYTTTEALVTKCLNQVFRRDSKIMAHEKLGNIVRLEADEVHGTLMEVSELLEIEFGVELDSDADCCAADTKDIIVNRLYNAIHNQY